MHYVNEIQIFQVRKFLHRDMLKKVKIKIVKILPVKIEASSLTIFPLILIFINLISANNFKCLQKFFLNFSKVKRKQVILQVYEYININLLKLLTTERKPTKLAKQLLLYSSIHFGYVK